MNLVGKILTVLIFVMSLVFATMVIMVYATHTNWRDMVERQQAAPGQPLGLKHQLAEAKREEDNLNEKLKKLQDDLNTEKQAKQNQVAELQTKIEELTRDRDNREKEIQELNKSTADAVATMKTTQDTLAALRTEVQTLRDNIRKAQQDRDESFKKSVALADESHQLQNEQKRLESRLGDLTIDRNRMRDLLRAYNVNPAEDPAAILPKVDGNVAAVVQGGLVELTIGSDDGLNKGHRLEVYRAGGGQSTYLGRIEVVRTAPDKAVCKILPEFRKGAIQTGDRVTSKLE